MGRGTPLLLLTTLLDLQPGTPPSRLTFPARPDTMVTAGAG